MRFFIFSLLLFGVCSCDLVGGLSERIDVVAFELFGGAVFDKPSHVTMKEIHLDRGMMVGQNVLVEGRVLDVGAYETHVVLSDKTARLLVVLTDLDAPQVLGKIDMRGQDVRILGTVDYGKKGLPFVLARSITIGESSVDVEG